MDNLNDSGSAVSVSETQLRMNDDVLSIVFEFLKVEVDPVPWRRRLARCAVVCRAFTEPATRLLWRDLNSLYPIWHLLAPQDLAYRRGYEWGAGSAEGYLNIILTAKLYDDPLRWDRLLWHTANVRSLTTWDASPAADKAQAQLVRAIMQNAGGRPILPLLHIICLHCPLPAHNYLLPLLSPGLRRVSIIGAQPSDVATTETDVSRVLRDIRRHSPDVESVYTNLEVGPLVVSEVLSFKQLKEVEVALARITGIKCFRDLATTPGDISLTLVHNRIFMPVFFSSSSNPVALCPGLRGLSLRADDPTFVQLFGGLRFPALEAVELVLDYTRYNPILGVPEVGIVQCTTTLIAAISVRRLHKLELTLHSYPHGSIRLSDIFLAVLPCSEMRFFSILLSKGQFIVNDDDLAAVAEEWPKLESFKLVQWQYTEFSTFPDSNVSHPSAAVLYHFSSHCPNLRLLHLPYLDTSVDADCLLAPASDANNPHRLDHLCIDNICNSSSQWRLTDSEATRWATRLLRLFPNMRPEPEGPGYELPPFLHRGGRGEGRKDGNWTKIFTAMRSISKRKIS